MIINNVSNFDDEPMEVDPGTPLFNRQLPPQQNHQQNEQEKSINQNNSPQTSPNMVKQNISKPNGAKIVKPIRPIGPRTVRPPSSTNVDDFDEYANINPFQSKPKIGFDSATSSSSSISNDLQNNDDFTKEDANPFQSRRILARSPSPSRDYIQTERISTEDINQTNDLINDEWETHKKRSSTSNRKSSISVNTQSNQPLSPNTNQSSSTSVMSSTTDISSVSSISPQENNQPQSHDLESNKEEQFENLDPFNTPPKINSKITSRKSLSTTLTDNCNNDENFLASGQLLDFENENNQSNQSSANTSNLLTADSVIFDSIFSNDTEFQSFLDLLEKKEKDNSIKKSPSKYSEFARKSLYLQFDPIIQNCRSLSPEKIKRLSIIRDKQESIKFFLREIAEEENETPQLAENTTINLNSNTNLNNQTLIDIDTNTNLKNNENNTSNRTNKLMDTTTNMNETQQNVNNDSEHHESNQEEQQLNETNLNNININNSTRVSDFNNTKRISSISSNTSFDQSKPNESVYSGNISILDLDRVTISNHKNGAENTDPDSFKLLSDDSMLDDIQLFNKSKLNLTNNKPKIPPVKLNNDEKLISLNSPTQMTTTSVTQLSVDDLSTASTTFDTNQSMSKLIAELNSMKEKEKGYLDQIRSLDEENKKFRVIVVEFETIIQNMDNNREESESKLKSEILELTKERDNLQEDVIGVERAFDDLHRRFEKLKTKVEEFKKNEEGLQKAIDSYKQQLEKEKLKYNTLKKHAEEKLELANNEIDKLRKSTGIELQALKAELRKAEIKISSLEISVHQKDQENSELTSLLEEIINKGKKTNN